MKLAIFGVSNRFAKWEDLAWALVADDDEAHDLAAANGFYSWQLQDDEQSPRMDFFKKSVQHLA